MHTCPAVPALRRLIFRGVRRLFALPQGITQGKRQQHKSGERRQKDDPRADHLYYTLWVNRSQPVNAFNWKKPGEAGAPQIEKIYPNIVPSRELES